MDTITLTSKRIFGNLPLGKILRSKPKLKNKLQLKVKGYALYVAIMVLFMVSLICGALLTLYELNDKEYYLYETNRRLRHNVESAFNEISVMGTNDGIVVKDLFGNKRDSVEINTRNWGVFDLISVKAFSGNHSRQKSALMGPLLRGKNEYALYMGNSSHPLQLCGNTNITGKAFLPEGGVKRSYIEGSNYTGDKLIYGEEAKSAFYLPEVKKEVIDNLVKYLKGQIGEGDSLGEYSKDSTKIIQSFSEKTLVFQSAGPMVLEDVELKGNIIIYSSQWIEIKKSAILEDVLIFAPVIFIDDEFSGSGQFFASDSLMTGRNCRLNYPSVLSVINYGGNNKSDDKCSLLHLGEGSKVLGGAFCYEEKQGTRMNVMLKLDKDSELYGQVYSNGYLELKGSVFGSVVCEKIILRTNSSVYDNHLLNATIDISKLPKDFVGFYLLKEESKFDILKFTN